MVDTYYINKCLCVLVDSSLYVLSSLLTPEPANATRQRHNTTYSHYKKGKTEKIYLIVTLWQVVQAQRTGAPNDKMPKKYSKPTVH